MEETTLNNYVSLIEERLKAYLPSKDCMQKDVIDAMEYSLLAKGKRIRPTLTLEFCRVCGGNIEEAMPFACAVEMIHTYSLIHDDLPCMDNDDLRRGLPTNHIANGEAIALLAGDALLTLAFEIILSEKTLKSVESKKVIAAANLLARSAGTKGMIGGQAIDVSDKIEKVKKETIELMHGLKTGALIVSASQIGAIIAGANDEEIAASIEYASALGLAFQIVDDILDFTSTTEKLGKSSLSDERGKKFTYVSAVGLEQSKEFVKELTNKAITALNSFKYNTDFLKDLALSLEKRDH